MVSYKSQQVQVTLALALNLDLMGQSVMVYMHNDMLA